MRPWQRALYALFLLGVLLLPRVLQLDHFVTPDEKRWMTRAGNFAHGLVQGELAHTFQKGHPGVTTMWAGALGYVFAFPAFPYVTPGQLGTTDTSPEDFFATQGKDPLQVLAAGRTVAVLVNVLAIGLALGLAARFMRVPYIGIGLLLAALDPFHMAHARLLHTDALLASFAFLTVVAYLCVGQSARPKRLLILSGAAAGLTWLTKTPGLFLIPFVGLLQLVHFGQIWRNRTGPTLFWRSAWRELVQPLLLWFGVAVITYVACWPAMWVAPLQTLSNVFSLSQEYAEEGHSSSIYFMGQLRWGDPGFGFYPISYLWRTTPVVLVGLGLALGYLIYNLGFRMLRPRSAQVYDSWLTGRSRREHPLPTPYSLLPTPHSPLLGLLGFALLYLLLMNLGAKKFDRYLLPIYMPLDLAAGMGWGLALDWLRRRVLPVSRQWTTVGLAGLVIGGQAGLALPTFPYYLTYYNPLLLRTRDVTNDMLIGWGEGLDVAARYLAQRPAAQQTTTAAWYGFGPFSWFYPGISLSLSDDFQADYLVFYQNEVQRELPARQLLLNYLRRPPEQTVTLNGIEYAWIYPVTEQTLPDYVVEWDGKIRLTAYAAPTGELGQGEPVELTLYLENRAPIAQNLNLLLRVVNAAGVELFRADRWPFGSATSTWPVGERWIDRVEFAIPPDVAPDLYRIELSFYDPATLDRLPMRAVASGEAVGDPLIIDYLAVGASAAAARIQALAAPVNFGDQVRLQRWQISDGQGAAIDAAAHSFPPGETITFEAQWQALTMMNVNYTGFLHIVNADGQLVAQDDHRPMGGFLPTRMWFPRQTVLDRYQITLPTDLPKGAYQLYVGLYEAESGTRLPILENGPLGGDALPVQQIEISPNP
ncbi:MAG: hypothetical protein R3A44_01000 [Caldilineaceae bacterium]